MGANFGANPWGARGGMVTAKIDSCGNETSQKIVARKIACVTEQAHNILTHESHLVSCCVTLAKKIEDMKFFVLL